jgi:hypothetical protein
VFWYAPRGRKAKADAEHYDDNLKQLGEFNTVENFFSFYCFMKRPSDVIDLIILYRLISITKSCFLGREKNRCGKNFLMVERGLYISRNENTIS